MGFFSNVWHSTTSGISKAAHVVANVTAPITKPVVAGANAVAHTAESAVQKVETTVQKVEKAGESVADHLLTDARVIENTLKQGVTAIGNIAEGAGGMAKSAGDIFGDIGKYLPWIIGITVLGGAAYAANQAGLFKKGKRSSA